MGGIVSGIGSAIGSIFGGGQSAPTQPNVQVYQPTGTGTADQNIQSLLNQNTSAVAGSNNPYNTLSPQIQQLFQSMFANPNAAGYQGAANNSGAASTAVGNQAVNASGQLNNAALGLLPGAQQVYNMGLDPQQALYNQQFQQTQDQANVANAQYGLTGQQAAGNLQQADTNFNTQWQANALNRALQGLQGAGAGIINADSGVANAANIGATGASNIAAGGATPYNASTTIGDTQQTALTNYIAQLLGPVTSSQQTIGDLSGYLGQGINASASGAQVALGDYNAQNAAQASLGSGLAGIAGLSNGGGGNLISSIFSGAGGGSSAASSAGFADGGSTALPSVLPDLGPAAAASSAASSSGGFADILASIASIFA